MNCKKPAIKLCEQITRKLAPEVPISLEQYDYRYFGDRLVVKVPPRTALGKGQVRFLQSQPNLGEVLWPGQVYPLMVEYENMGEDTLVTVDFEQAEVEPLTFVARAGRHSVAAPIVTPYDSGTYRPVVKNARGEALTFFEADVNYEEYLRKVKFEATLPRLRCEERTEVNFTLKGPDMTSKGNLMVFTRFKRPGGDYATAGRPSSYIALDFPRTDSYKLSITAASVPGDYELEFWFYHPLTGRSIKTDTSLPVTVTQGK